jgi:hypothetical protein
VSRLATDAAAGGSERNGTMLASVGIQPSSMPEWTWH